MIVKNQAIRDDVAYTEPNGCTPVPDLARKVAGTVETASFFNDSNIHPKKSGITMLTDFFPSVLNKTIGEIFDSIPFTPSIIRIIPAADEIAPGLLCHGERRQLQRYTFPKRRSEFLSGRICAKLTVCRYLQKRHHF